MDNFLLLSVFGVLALYFYSSASTYKTLYRKTVEEKELVEEKNKNLVKLKEKFEKQVEYSLDTINDSQESLKSTREDYQALKLENAELEHKNKLLQQRVDELYASVGTVY
jgi:chromosome segregation ATPase